MIDLEKINTLVVSASKASQEKSYTKTPLRVSLLDPITRVYSKDFFDVQYEIHWNMSLRQKTSVSLFVIKVNELASLNLANGQNSGDYALQKLAKCLSLLFRRATDLIFRTDEDQFMILTTQMDKTQSDFYVNQIKLRIKNLKIMNRKTNEQLTANVGCAFVVPKANMKSDVIIKDALKQLD